MQAPKSYTENFQPICRFFYYKNVGSEEIEELAQETFLRFFSRYNPEEIEEITVKKILYGIAKLVYKEWVRKRVQLPVYELDRDIPFEPTWQELEDDSLEEVVDTYGPLLTDAIAALSPSVRDVITLRFIEGCTRHETSERLGISEKHVHVYQRRGIKAIKEHIRQRTPDAPLAPLT